ncbi:MAG TPA: hypothetical protein VF483_12940 [Gemmatimonadaceae bacterium]
MPITRTCNPNVLVVQLNITAGHKLRYTVGGNPAVRWTLGADDGTVILKHPAVQETDWPAPGAHPAPGQQIHTLAIAMAGTQTLRWRVQRLAADGSVLEVLKDCTYDNVGVADDFDDAITVNLI